MHGAEDLSCVPRSRQKKKNVFTICLFVYIFKFSFQCIYTMPPCHGGHIDLYINVCTLVPFSTSLSACLRFVGSAQTIERAGYGRIKSVDFAKNDHLNRSEGTSIVIRRLF